MSKPDNAKQSSAFVAKALELGADADDTPTDRLMARMADLKPEPRPKKTPATLKKVPGRSRSGARSPD